MCGWDPRRERLVRGVVVNVAVATMLALSPIAATAVTDSRAPASVLLQSLDAMPAWETRWTQLAYDVEAAALAGYRPQPDDLTRTEHRAFRGIGTIVCTVGGTRRSSTAFLVGAFDIAVTVAHTFEHTGVWARSSDCVYHSADRWGQIRERIPIAYFKAQWREDPRAFGQPAKDLAMVRLSRASRFAYRTLSFSRFSGSAAPVMLIGFRSDPDFEPLRHKRSGTLFEDAGGDFRTSGVSLLMHDIDTRGLASGAPLLDRRDGVVIGIHAKVPNETGSRPARAMHERRNAMLVMTEWLEDVLRTEISEVPATDSEQATVH